MVSLSQGRGRAVGVMGGSDLPTLIIPQKHLHPQGISVPLLLPSRVFSPGKEPRVRGLWILPEPSFQRNQQGDLGDLRAPC